MTSKYTLAVVALFTLMGPALAHDQLLPVAVNKADFDVAKTQLVQQLNSNRTAITEQDKKAIIDALDRIDAHLGKATAPDQLNEQDRVDLFNDQELINTITAHAAADSRILCKREVPTGSHRIQTVCMTLAACTEMERNGREAMITAKYDESRLNRGEY